MFYKRKGFPEAGDLVLCTVKKILFHSIFVDLDEYENKEGMIHISEIAPGRIRNIRDYVKEDKKIICKILKVDKEKNYIDLSLRRVGSGARATKNNEYKQEQKAEKLLEQTGKKLNLDLKQMYEQAGNMILEEYGSLYNCFQDVVVNGKTVLDNLKINPKIKEELSSTIIEKIKLPEVKIKGNLMLQYFTGDGIEKIKEILINIEELSKDKVIVRCNYISAPQYRITVTGPDYKSAEKIFGNIENLVEKLVKKEGIANLEKIEE